LKQISTSLFYTAAFQRSKVLFVTCSLLTKNGKKAVFGDRGVKAACSVHFEQDLNGIKVGRQVTWWRENKEQIRRSVDNVSVT
jgi:hypothetical protein